MGIIGLLPLLKSIHKHCTLKKFAGQTIGIDAYGWLHRGTVACAIELALGQPTTKHVEFAVRRVRMLLDFGITPYLVFDGDALPSKAGTNLERRKKRDESKALGLELYKAGKRSQAHQELQKAADVTPYMARQLIEELKRLNVQYIVAPYEADAQLAYLEQKGIIDGILSEDSDLLVFGAKRLITKLNEYGECVEIERADFASCREVSLAGWTDSMFRRMAILSGCDYLSNINKMGLKTAYRFVRKYKDTEKVLRMIQFEGQFTVPVDYLQNFKNAELAFLHHRVFCPIRRQLVFLNELGPGTKEADMPFLGPDVDAETAVGVACGDLNPKTKELIVMKPTATASRPSLGDQRRQTLSSSADLKPKKSIDAFFKRQPLAELDPNSLTPSPSQRRLLQIHANASWEMRTISSAPQLRRTTTSVASPGVPGRTPSTDRSSFLARAAVISTYQPPKRQRLCSEADETSPSTEIKQSPFFASSNTEASPLIQKKGRGKKARKSDFEVFSDDSLDGIMLGLPEVQQVASPNPPKEGKNTQVQIEDDGIDKIIQSSPLLEKKKPGRVGDISRESSDVSYPTLFSQDYISQDTPATPLDRGENDPDFFIDLFELYESSQRDSLLKTFVCQSPPSRAKALASISPSDQAKDVAMNVDDQISSATSTTGLDGACESSVAERLPKESMDNIRKTFAYQSQSSQARALGSLGPSQTQSEKIKLGKAALAGVVSTEVRRPGMSALQRLKEQAMRQATRQERALPGKGSEDLIAPNSEDEGDSGAEEEVKPSLDLKAYVFTTP